MIQVSPELRAALNSVENQPVDLYELYLDGGPLCFADQDITWGGNHYLAKVKSRSEIKRYLGGQFDDVTVTFSNVDTTMAQALLANDIEGRRLVIRKIDRSIADDSIVLFDGRMDPLSHINETEAEISAKHVLGSIDFDAPARTFCEWCPWEFKGIECGYEGAETACDKSWARCTQLGRTNRYGGFRFIPHAGTYQYQEVTTSRFLGIFRRKKTKTITASFASVDDTPYDVPIPIIYGRVQIAGIDIQHEDQGSVTRALVAFAIGKVKDFFYIRANESAVGDVTCHYGNFGGDIGQEADPRISTAYPYSQLAYLGLSIPSDVKAVDPAPNVTAVILGRQVPVFDASGAFTGDLWTDNPVWNVRDFMCLPLSQGGMGLPEEMVDNIVAAETAAYCDEMVDNWTNDQKIYNPVNLPEGVDYKRYRSTGADGPDVSEDGPYADYAPGVDDDTSTEPVNVPVKRFTMNVALAKQEKAVDILFNKLLPSFRGYLTQSADGKLQIRCERPVKNEAATAAAAAGGDVIHCATPSRWAVGELVLASPLTDRAEVLRIAAVLGDGLQFAAPLAFLHSEGEMLVQVAMAFDDSNIVKDFEYPLADQQSSTNRITIKYVDAPSGFQETQLQVNDYTHQAQVHKVNNEDLDGGAIDSYNQAWRIGEWLRAKRRDLGKFCSFTADIKATLLEVGDVIVVSAKEAGLQAVPFLVNEAGFEENDEVTLLGQLYSLDVYSDTAPQCTVKVPTIFSPAPAPVAAPKPPAPNLAADWLSGLAAYTVPNGHETDIGYLATITPPEGSDTTHLAAIHISRLVDGQRAELLTLYGPFAVGTGYAWKSDPVDVAGEAASVTLEFACENEDSAITAAPYTVVINLAGATPAENSVAGEDLAAQRWTDEHGTHTVVGFTPVVDHATYPLTLTSWRTRPARAGESGPVRTWNGWSVMAGPGELSIGAKGTPTEGTVFPPESADENWTVTFAVGAIDSSVAPPVSAKTSAPFVVRAIGAPSAGVITSLVLSAPAAGDWPYNHTVDETKAQDWLIPQVSMPEPGGDAGELAFWTLTAQDLDASHHAIGPERRYGVIAKSPVATTRVWGALEGQYGTIGYGYDRAYPFPGGAPAQIAYVRLKVYGVSRNDPSDTSWSNPASSAQQMGLGGGSGYTDVPVAAGGNPPPGKVSAVTVAAPGNVTIGTPEYTDLGNGEGRLRVPYTPPAGDTLFNGVLLEVEMPDQSAAAPLTADGTQAWDGTHPATGDHQPLTFGPVNDDGAHQTSVIVPAPPIAETIRIRVRSASANAVVPASTSPSVTLPIPAATSAPNPQSGSAFTACATWGVGPATVSAPYNLNGKLEQDITFEGVVTPTDARFSGWEIWSSGWPGDPNVYPETSVQSPGAASVTITVQAPTSQIPVTYWLRSVSIDAAGNVNRNPIVPGVTPSVAVTLGVTGGKTLDPHALPFAASLGIDPGGNFTFTPGPGLALNLPGLPTLALGVGMVMDALEQLTLNLGDGLTTAGSQVTVNLGDGLAVTLGKVAVNAGNGLTASGGALTLNLGGGLTMSGAAVAVNAGNGLQLSGGAVTVNAGDGLQLAGGAVKINLGNGMTTSAGALTLNLGGGLTMSGAAVAVNAGNGVQVVGGVVQAKYGNGLTLNLGSLQINTGNGLIFSGTALQVNLGNGLTYSGTAVQLNLGNGLTFSGSTVQANVGGGLTMSGGQIAISVGNGVTLSGGALTLSLGNGLSMSGSQVAVNLGNGMTTSGGALTLNLGNGLTMSGSVVTTNVGGGLSYSGVQIIIANGGVGPNQIASVNASQLNAGSVNVGSGGMTFSGTGGITIAGSGNISVLTGSVSSYSYLMPPTGGEFAINSAFGSRLSVNGVTAIDSARNGSFANLTIAGLPNFSSTWPTASAGAATLPASPVGFLNIQVSGTNYKVPYYGV